MVEHVKGVRVISIVINWKFIYDENEIVRAIVGETTCATNGCSLKNFSSFLPEPRLAVLKGLP
jgi:hypothetical protein